MNWQADDIADVGDLLAWLGTDELLDENEDEDVDECFVNIKEDELEYLTSKQFSQNTSKKILAVIKLFKLWVTNKNKNLRMSTVPTKSIEEWSCDELCTWLPVFICEARKIDGGYYRLSTELKHLWNMF